MTSTPDTSASVKRSSSTTRELIFRLGLIVAVPMVVGIVNQAAASGMDAGPMAGAAVAQQGAGSGVWWTTTACPAGAPVPCVGMGAVEVGLPTAELDQAGQAQRQCLTARGYDATAAYVEPRADDLELCRRAGVAAALATHADQAAAAAARHTAVPASSARGGSVQEDGPAWSCARNGNHVCGPGNPSGAPAGCYSGGELVVPWSNYSDPKSDPLYGRFTAPC